MSQDALEPPVPPRGTLNESRWDEILSAAARVFGEKGYRSATLRDVASQVGMLKGSLYYYIDNKEDLLFEILRRSHLRGIEFVKVDAMEQERAADPPARLARLVRNWMAGLEALPASLSVSEADRSHLREDRRAEIEKLRRTISQVPYNIITAGVRDGSFDQTVDPYVATATILRILNSTPAWYRPGGRVSWSDLTEWYVRLILRGLGANPPAEPAPER